MSRSFCLVSREPAAMRRSQAQAERSASTTPVSRVRPVAAKANGIAWRISAVLVPAAVETAASMAPPKIAAQTLTAQTLTAQTLTARVRTERLSPHPAVRSRSCSQWNAGHSALPIIAMSANAMCEERNPCLKAGINDSISPNPDAHYRQGAVPAVPHSSRAAYEARLAFFDS